MGPLIPGESVFELTCTNAAGSAKGAGRIATASDVKLERLEFVELSMATHSSIGLFSIPGEPMVGAATLAAEIFGPIRTQSTTFELMDGDGNVLEAPALIIDPDAQTGATRYVGSVTVPERPFRVRVRGLRQNGETFDRMSGIHHPQSLRIAFASDVPALISGVATPVPLDVLNSGIAVDALVLCNGEAPLRVEPDRSRVSLAANGSIKLPIAVTAVAPIDLSHAEPRLTCSVVPLTGATVGSGNRVFRRLLVSDVAMASQDDRNQR